MTGHELRKQFMYIEYKDTELIIFRPRKKPDVEVLKELVKKAPDGDVIYLWDGVWNGFNKKGFVNMDLKDKNWGRLQNTLYGIYFLRKAMQCP